VDDNPQPGQHEQRRRRKRRRSHEHSSGMRPEESPGGNPQAILFAVLGVGILFLLLFLGVLHEWGFG